MSMEKSAHTPRPFARRLVAALGTTLTGAMVSTALSGSPAGAQQSTFPEAPPDCSQLMGSIVVIDPPSPVHPTSFSVRYSLGTILRDDIKMSYTFTVTTPTGPFAVPPPAVRTQRGAAGDFDLPATPGRFSFEIEVFSIGVGTGTFGAGAKCKTVHNIVPTTTLPDLSGPTSKRATPVTIGKVKVADNVRVQPQTIITTSTSTTSTTVPSTTMPSTTMPSTTMPSTSTTTVTTTPSTPSASGAATTSTPSASAQPTQTTQPTAGAATKAIATKAIATKKITKKTVKKTTKKRTVRTTKKRTPSTTK